MTAVLDKIIPGGVRRLRDRGKGKVPRRLWYYQLMIAAALIVPFLIVGIVLISHFVASERAYLESSAREKRDLIVAALDREMMANFALLRALATSPALDGQPDLRLFDERARSLLKVGQSIILLDARSKRQLVNTRLPYGADLPKNFTVTEAIAVSLDQGRESASQLFKGVNSGEWQLQLVVPVKRNGEVPYLLVESVRPSALAPIFSSLAINPPYYATIIDDDGRIIARSSETEKHLGRVLPGYQKSFASDRSWSGVNVQGVAVLGFIRRSEVTGWHVTIGIAQAALQEPLTRSLVLLGVLAAGLGAASLAAVIAASRRMKQTFRVLVNMADGVGRGELLTPPQTYLTGANAIGSALAQASHQLHEKSHALAEANRLLEQRVEERTAELIAARDRAELAGQAKAKFLANMSHELRTPLTAIIGVSEMLLAGQHGPERQHHLLMMQRNSGKGLLRIISDILDFSRMEAGQLALEKSPFSLRELANGCIEMVTEQAQGKDLALTTTISHDVPDAVLGDVTRLRQVLLNLLGNAVKFTASGSVTLAIEPGGAPAAVRFTVVDTGIGIIDSDLSTLFQRFMQADSSTTRRFGGSGLGLAISKELVDLMGGKIEVESRPGYGSTFSFAIMLPPAGQVPAEIAAPAKGSGSRYRLLLAEDNPINRELIKAMLEQAGHGVTTVNDGAEAVQVALRNGFDAILMDVQMPEMDGYAAARMIRIATKDQPRLPMIALTANALPGESERCLAAGMSVHIAKPVDWAALHATLERLVTEDRHAGGASSSATKEKDVGPTKSVPAPAFDEATLVKLRNTLGRESVQKLLYLFAADARTRFEDRSDTAAACEAIRREAHTFGGSAALLGFLELAEACRALEAVEGDAFGDALDRCRRERDAALRTVGEFTLDDQNAPAESASA